MTKEKKSLSNECGVHENAYLLSRGVRLMALLDVIHNDDHEACRAYDRAFDITSGLGAMHALIPIPFAIQSNRFDKSVHVGFASHEWVIDMYRWALSGEMSEENFHRVRGLLLGYSGSAIAAFERVQIGQPYK